MKLLNKLVGLTVTVLSIWFLYVWMFVPDRKHDMQDRWYGMMTDCEQLYAEVSNHQRCKVSADCELARTEAINAEALEAQYARYCGKF
jgi:uncharacterized membrane protein YqhA